MKPQLLSVAALFLLFTASCAAESPLSAFLAEHDGAHRWFGLALEHLGVQYDNESAVTLLLPEPKNSRVSDAWASRVPLYKMEDLEDMVLVYVLPQVFATPEELGKAGDVITAAGTVASIRTVEGQIRVKLIGQNGFISVFNVVPQPIIRGKVVIYSMHKVVPEYEQPRREGTVLATAFCPTTFCVDVKQGITHGNGQPVEALFLKVTWEDSSDWREGSAPSQRLTGQQVVAGERRCWDLSKVMGQGQMHLELSTASGEGGRAEARVISWDAPEAVDVFRRYEDFFGGWATVSWKTSDAECTRHAAA